MPTAPTRVPVGEVDTGATDRVPVIATSDEYDESDTIVVSIPKYAHSTRGTQSSDPTITGQEENKAFDSAASPAETEVAQEQLTPQEESFAFDSAASPAETVQEQQVPQEELLAEMDGPTALVESPASELGEMNETWVRSYSLLDTDEESVWLQPLPPSQPVEEPTWLQSVTDPHTDVEQPAWLQSLAPSQTRESEEHTPANESEEHTLFSASSYTDEEDPNVHLTAPAADDGDNESPKTIIVSSPKRHRSKRKRNEMKKARLQMVPEEESDQSEPITPENISKGNDEEPA